jgi:hypothetical protein
LHSYDVIFGAINSTNNVATPLLEECEDDIHTPEMGTWESFETPEILELDYKGSKHLALRISSCHWKAIEV